MPAVASPITRRLVSVVAAAVLGVVALVAWRGTSDEPTEGTSPADASPASVRSVPYGLMVREGDPMPELAFSRADGTELDFADLVGRPVVLNFFASWCGPCVAEMPRFEEVHRELGDEVAFVGIGNDQSDSRHTEIVESTGVTYDTVRDPDGEALVAFGINGMPTTIFVGADGRLTSIELGEVSEDELRTAIEEELLG